MVVNSGITYEATTDTPEAHVSKLVALIENGAGEITIIGRGKNIAGPIAIWYAFNSIRAKDKNFEYKVWLVSGPSITVDKGASVMKLVLSAKEK